MRQRSLKRCNNLVEFIRLTLLGFSLMILIIFNHNQSFGFEIAQKEELNLNSTDAITSEEIECNQLATSQSEPADQATTSLITGARTAIPGDIPFQVRLRIHESRRSITCGGVIIDKRTILTAAHCVERADTIKIYIGDHNQFVPDGEQLIETKKIILHPNYRQSCQDNLAIIKTIQTMSWRRTSTGFGSVDRICLPKANTVSKGGQLVRISGWGLETEDRESDDLRLIDVRLSKKAECERYLQFNLTPGQICYFSDEHKNSWNSLSGGPVFRYSTAGRAELVGIVSCGWRSVHYDTRVAHYVNWIKMYMD